MKQQLPYAPTADRLFAPLLNKNRPVLLHSADTSNRFGRYDIMSAEPVDQISWSNGMMKTGTRQYVSKLPLQSLAEEHRLFCSSLKQNQDPSPPPFSAGFIGYFAYPLHQSLERQTPAAEDITGIPDLQGGLYDWSIVTDHEQRTTHLYTQNTARERQVLSWLDTANSSTNSKQPGNNKAINLDFQPSNSDNDYRAAFQQIQAYLDAGDCYQVNLARHFSAPFHGDPWQLYQYWCQQQAAPFNAYLDLSPTQDTSTVLLSLSPERFLEIEEQRAWVCPIKGTTARGKDATQDQALADQLMASAKDQAENLMIVDLLRNDLGRICETGSVEVTHLFELLKFTNVQHLVSTITGKLPPNTSVMQAFTALFPSGSITGAPKIRAIDIINELEPVGRSIYCGSVGYWDRSGRFDSNVAIRTGLLSEGKVHLWGGGGIVTDSECNSELVEIQQKIGRLLASSPAPR